MDTLYWSQCARNRNFGDVLSSSLLKHFTGKDYVWAPANEASMVCIGSIIEHLPARFTGTVVGSGKARASTRKDLSKANVLLLRGPFTAETMKLVSKPAFGDPGLLACDLVGPVDKVHKVGFLPHYADRQMVVPYNAFRINILDDPLKVIQDVASCESLVTSSLHGLILADSLNIPRKWVKYSRIQGGGFKFQDYAAGVGVQCRANVWHEASNNKIVSKQEQLRELFSCL
jgi:hypothetical protein